MTTKNFLQILRKYYAEPMVKAVRAGINKPSYEKMCQMNKEDGIEFEFWRDVRGWFNAQKRAEREAKQLKKAKKENK